MTSRQARGFALLDPAVHRRIAAKGGKAAHAKGTAHQWTAKEAREAGRKGGLAHHRLRGGEVAKAGKVEPDPSPELS